MLTGEQSSVNSFRSIGLLEHFQNGITILILVVEWIRLKRVQNVITILVLVVEGTRLRRVRF